MKIQVWFREDQADLVVRCLKYVQGKLNSGAPLSDAHAMAGQYTYARISEVVKLFEEKKSSPPPQRGGIE